MAWPTLEGNRNLGLFLVSVLAGVIPKAECTLGDSRRLEMAFLRKLGTLSDGSEHCVSCHSCRMLSRSILTARRALPPGAKQRSQDLTCLSGGSGVVLSAHPDSWLAFAGSPAAAGYFSTDMWEMFPIQVSLFLLRVLLRLFWTCLIKMRSNKQNRKLKLLNLKFYLLWGKMCVFFKSFCCPISPQIVG